MATSHLSNHACGESIERGWCQDVAAISPLLVNAQRNGKPDVELLSEAVRLIESLAWEPDERTPLSKVAAYLDRNAQIFKVDLAPANLDLGPSLSLGRVRGLTMVWPLTEASYERLLENDGTDWRDIALEDILPTDATRHGTRSLYLESVVSLPVALAGREWFRASSPPLDLARYGGMTTFHRMLAHAADFAPVMQLNDSLLLASSSAFLPRFMAEVRPSTRSEGNRMTSMYGFVDVAATTSSPENWRKRHFDFEWYRNHPLPPKARRFAVQLLKSHSSI